MAEKRVEGYDILLSAILDKIENTMATLYWNKNQKELESPFQNTGATYQNDVFTVRAYNWDGNYEPNFLYQGLHIFWYKHSGRGIAAYSSIRVDAEYLNVMLENCLDALHRDFEGEDYYERKLEEFHLEDEISCRKAGSKESSDEIAKPELKVQEITLLSAKEAENVDQYILAGGSWWWLRSPGKDPRTAASVNESGHIISRGNGVNISGGIRPALRIENLESGNYQIGDVIRIADKAWTVVSSDLVLYNGIIGHGRFRKEWEASDSNDYEASDVKKWLHNWAAENNIQMSGISCAEKE